MPRSAVVSPPHSPRQARSRAREAALVRAAGVLMRQRPFDQIPVAELAREAGTSVGGFYARVGSKEGLLHLLDARIVDDCRAEFDAAMSEEAMRGATALEVVRAYTRAMVAKFREHRESLVQIIRAAKSGDAAWAARTEAFNARVHGRLRELLDGRRAEIGHPDPTLAINLGLAFASATAREVVLAGSLRAYPVAVDDAQLISELTGAWARYLMLTSSDTAAASGPTC